MKTAKYSLLLLAVLALTTSCHKEYITRQYITEEKTIIQGMDMDLIDFTVKENNWIVREVDNGTEEEGFFEAVLEEEKISQDVVDKGVVMVYRVLQDGKEKVFTPLPSTFTEKIYLDDEQQEPYTFDTRIDYEWRKGAIHIFVTTSDLFIGTTGTPGEMTFRVAIQM